ncbi:MAG: sulfatase [Pirellulales bacterium]
MRPYLLTTLSPALQVALLWSAICSAQSPPENQSVPLATARPNVLLILADDLGVNDLGCYGADLHETPHIDRLAQTGVRFLTAYSPAPVCTPTRASLLTGKHPARLGITIWSEGSKSGPQDRKLFQAESLHDLPHTEVTLAEKLQSAGWLCASVGKWHLGDADHAPETHGFDINIGGTHWGAPQTFFWPYRGTGRFGSEFRYVPHLEFGKAGEYLTDRLTDESIKVIDHAAEIHRPFFLLLGHHAPHTPIEAKSEHVSYFQTKLKSTFHHRNATYAAMIRSLDESVGRLVARLKSLNQLDNTIIIFTSDNGGYVGNDSSGNQITDNYPLKSGKGSLFEGGIRVPLIVNWPKSFPTASTRIAPVVLTDLFPTLLALTENSADTHQFDGVDLTAYLNDESKRPARQSLMFHYPHYYHAPPTTPCGAIRHEDWKLIENFEDGKFELFNLGSDPSETNDLASQNPEKLSDLKSLLTKWRESVGATMPRPNDAKLKL